MELGRPRWRLKTENGRKVHTLNTHGAFPSLSQNVKTKKKVQADGVSKVILRPDLQILQMMTRLMAFWLPDLSTGGTVHFRRLSGHCRLCGNFRFIPLTVPPWI